MKLVTISTSLLKKYHNDPEVLFKSKRPYVLIIHLKYKGKYYDFAIPIRSNIPHKIKNCFSIPCQMMYHNHHLGVRFRRNNKGTD